MAKDSTSGLEALEQPSSPLRRIIAAMVEAGRLPADLLDGKSMSPAQARFQIFITSFVILFFELICIRWIPAYVRYVGYFMNFILLASFLGIGIGILAGRRHRLWLPPFPLFLLLMVLAVGLTRFELPVVSSYMLFYGVMEEAAKRESFLVVPLLFTLVTGAFVILARPLSRLFTMLPPLQAYGMDILGSLAGIAAFFVMSYLALPPLVWFSILALAMVPLLRWRMWLRNILFISATLFVVHAMTGNSYWSPYYRILAEPNDEGGYAVSVNQVGHQGTAPSLKREVFYFQPYLLFGERPYKRVLVIGAGTGTDVAVALMHGVEHVDAVEIDPIIYQIGRFAHPEHPYDDPRVRVIINDGRAFLQNSDEHYDLIIFALTDSLTLTSAFSSLRLESFLLTTEGIAGARDHLSDDGLVVLYNFYREDWLVQKLAGMIHAAFGTEPFVTSFGAWGRAATMMAGPRLQYLEPELDVAYTESPGGDLPERGRALPVIGYGRLAGDEQQPPATDDWPFIYLRFPSLSSVYLGGLATIAVVALIMLPTAAPRNVLRRFNWHFFFLGVAFMLLETHSLVTFALLFGTTWMVNSLVFFAILVSVLVAILVNSRFRSLRAEPIYVCLFGALFLSYLLPRETLLGIDNAVLRYTVASILAFLPVFLANVVFSHSFRDAEEADIAFGSNLLGAMVGGMLEYLSLISGYKALLLLIMLCYLLSVIFWRRIPRLGVLAPVTVRSGPDTISS